MSDVYFNGTVKLLDLENSLFGATTMALSLVLAEFYRDNVLNVGVPRIGFSVVRSTVMLFCCLGPVAPTKLKSVLS